MSICFFSFLNLFSLFKIKMLRFLNIYDTIHL
uniref:Uncharacterized protein n=1 Tax=Myoviridae sp. ct5Tq8 TaxID=2826612 RepID=A0A8S5NDL2_9CAUD|nr:MAG TPA: hypothetical protein [Myoviridae sp. ct5Tq8]